MVRYFSVSPPTAYMPVFFLAIVFGSSNVSAQRGAIQSDPQKTLLQRDNEQFMYSFMEVVNNDLLANEFSISPNLRPKLLRIGVLFKREYESPKVRRKAKRAQVLMDDHGELEAGHKLLLEYEQDIFEICDRYTRLVKDNSPDELVKKIRERSTQSSVNQFQVLENEFQFWEPLVDALQLGETEKNRVNKAISESRATFEEERNILAKKLEQSLPRPAKPEDLKAHEEKLQSLRLDAHAKILQAVPSQNRPQCELVLESLNLKR